MKKDIKESVENREKDLYIKREGFKEGFSIEELIKPPYPLRK